jgi:Tol biopolymer transport system component
MADASSPKDPTAIFLLSVEKAKKRRLTSPSAETLSDDVPAFSPDGRTLAFRRTLKTRTAGIYLQALADGVEPTGQPQRLNITMEANHGKKAINGLDWTADGSSIIFSSLRVEENAVVL